MLVYRKKNFKATVGRNTHVSIQEAIGEASEGIQYFQNSRKSNKGFMEKFQKGITYYKEGKFEEALAIFNQLVAGDSSVTEYLLYRGRIHSRMGNLREAQADFDELINKEPYNTNFISDRAVVLHLLQKNEEALSELDRALSLDPNNPYRYSSRAFLKDRMGDFEGAIADYEKAIEMDPEDAVAYNNKGLVEEKLGYKQRSKKSFEKADDLVGYTPKDQKEEVDKDYSDKQEIPHQLKEEKEVTLSSYLSTLMNVFNDQSTRKEFFQFLSSKFRNK